MSDLTTEYRVNEQGMIVEEIEELEISELEEKANPHHSYKDSIPENIVTSTSS